MTEFWKVFDWSDIQITVSDNLKENEMIVSRNVFRDLVKSFPVTISKEVSSDEKTSYSVKP